MSFPFIKQTKSPYVIDLIYTTARHFCPPDAPASLNLVSLQAEMVDASACYEKSSVRCFTMGESSTLTLQPVRVKGSGKSAAFQDCFSTSYPYLYKHMICFLLMLYCLCLLADKQTQHQVILQARAAAPLMRMEGVFWQGESSSNAFLQRAWILPPRFNH